MITIVCKVSHKSLSNKNHHAFSSGYSFSKSMIEVLPFFFVCWQLKFLNNYRTLNNSEVCWQKSTRHFSTKQQVDSLILHLIESCV